ncbi:MAG TPA: hypothetical protein VKU38_09625 [Ktedonobacteraceae bacterium]|nr:hypothetical protein [Ktedonobacteraceae bacterium]
MASGILVADKSAVGAVNRPTADLSAKWPTREFDKGGIHTL